MEVRKIGSWDAYVVFDEVENIHTIAFAGQGGAIVSSHSPIEAERKFVEAMQLSEAAAMLLRKATAEEALLASYNKKQELIKNQISWVELNIKWAIEKGKTSCMQENETLYDEVIEHFKNKGYEIKNDYSCDSFGYETLSRFPLISDNSFHYWRCSWEVKREDQA